MVQNRFLRWLKYITLRHPLATVITVFTLYCLSYHFLNRLPFAQEVLNTVMMLFSSETAVIMLYRQGKRLGTIIIRLLLTEVFILIFDFVIVTFIIRWSWSREIIKLLSKWGNALVRDVKCKIRTLLPEISNGNGTTTQFLRRLTNAHKEPSKAGLKIVFTLGAIPKPPLVPIGGVSIGVLVVQYNHFGWRGWLALISGILVRNTIWLLGVYGISAII